MICAILLSKQLEPWGYLRGEPIVDVIPKVPAREYKGSLLCDLDWALERAREFPTCGILTKKT
jgi:hypothetical protein